MKNCSDCPYRVELNPHFREIPFSETPCARCKLSEFKTSGEVTLHEGYEHPGFTTWPVIDPWYPCEQTSQEAELLRLYLGATKEERAAMRENPPNGVIAHFVDNFTEPQELDAIDAIFNWHRASAENGRQRGRTRHAQFAAMKRLREKANRVGAEYADAKEGNEQWTMTK